MAVESGAVIAQINDLSGNGLHAVQEVFSKRPVLEQDENGDWFIQGDSIDDELPDVFPDMGANCTVGYVTRSEVRLEEGVTLNGSYGLPIGKGLAGFFAVDRALTKAEKIRAINSLASKVTGINYGASINNIILACMNAVDVLVYDTTKDSDGGAWAISYPKQMLIVPEASAVKIFDLTDPDVPQHTVLDFTGYTVTSVAAMEGMLYVGTTTGLAEFNIALGDVTVGLDYTTATSPAIIDNDIESLGIKVLSGAPDHPTTGLKVPTVSVGTDGAGMSVILSDGTVNDYNNAVTFKSVDFIGSSIVAWVSDARVALVFDDFSMDGFSVTRDYDEYGALDIFRNSSPEIAGSVSGISSGKFALGVAGSDEDAGLYLIDDAKGMYSKITSDYPTGWMVGNVLACLLADTEVGDLTEDIALIDDFATDITGWIDSSGGASSISWNAAGMLQLNNVGGDAAHADVSFATEVGKTYFARAISGSGTNGYRLDLGTSQGGNNLSDGPLTTLDKVVSFVATATTTWMRISSHITDGHQVLIEGVDVSFVIQDRSVKNTPLTVTNTITRTRVAEGAELVWHTFAADCTVDLGSDITASGSMMWLEKIGGAAVHHVLNYDGSDSYVDGVVGTPPTTGVEIVGTVMTFKAGATLALVRPSATPVTASQAATASAEELSLCEPKAACTLYGASNAVPAVDHDPDTDLLHAGTSAGRSVFDGLKRVGNTTTSVSKAISAVGGLIAEK